MIFYNKFGHNPDRVTCTCCGNDYSISDPETLDQATGYDRNCTFKGDNYIEKTSDDRYSLNKYTTLEEYLKQDGVKVIYQNEISEADKQGEVPEQGYVWKD